MTSPSKLGGSDHPPLCRGHGEKLPNKQIVNRTNGRSSWLFLEQIKRDVAKLGHSPGTSLNGEMSN